MIKALVITPNADLQAEKDKASAAHEAARVALIELERRRETAATENAQAEADVESCGLRLAEVGDTEASQVFQAATMRVAEIRARLQAFDTNVIPSAQGRLAAAKADETNAVRALEYQAALVARNEASAELEAFLSELGPAFRAVLLKLARAKIAVADVNRLLPAGAVPIIDPETYTRSPLPRRRELVVDELVDRWTHDDGRPVHEPKSPHLRDHGNGTGLLTGDYFGKNSRHSAEKVYRRPWRHRVWRETGGSGQRLHHSQLAAMHIPGVRADDLPFWIGGENMHPSEIVRLLADPVKCERPTQETWTLELGQ